MSDDFGDASDNKLAPENVRLALIRAGAFLTGYELVKSSIVDGVKDFFIIGFNERGLLYSPDYEKRVLQLGKSAFQASLNWLVSSNALSESQANQLEAIRTHRHEVAHDLARLLVDPEAHVDVDKLSALIEIMHDLDRFWGGIEIETSGEFEVDDVDYEGIRGGSGLLMDYLGQLSELTSDYHTEAQ